MRVLSRWPLVSFFVLAYALSWWVVPFGSTSFPVFPYGPDLALLLVVGLTAGAGGLRRVLAGLTRWRARPAWYAFALLAPLVIAVASVAVMPLLGAPASALPRPSSALDFVLVLPVMALVGGPLGEELGWRGYALPVLQQRHRPLVAALVLGAGHLLWHLPLFFTSDPPPVGPFVVDLLGGAVVLAWLMNTTGRILLPILLHASHNMSQQAFMTGFTGPDLVTVQWLAAAGWVLTALVVIWSTRGTLAADGRPPLTAPLHDRQADLVPVPARRVSRHVGSGVRS